MNHRLVPLNQPQLQIALLKALEAHTVTNFNPVHLIKLYFMRKWHLHFQISSMAFAHAISKSAAGLADTGHCFQWRNDNGVAPHSGNGEPGVKRGRYKIGEIRLESPSCPVPTRKLSVEPRCKTNPSIT
jgi:hypothetical protein